MAVELSEGMGLVSARFHYSGLPVGVERSKGTGIARPPLTQTYLSDIAAAAGLPVVLTAHASAGLALHQGRMQLRVGLTPLPIRACSVLSQ